MPRFSNRTIGILAIAIPFWFALIYFVMSSVRADYSHATKAISELGSLDAPNRWVWNIGGYVIPGVVIALLGAGISPCPAIDRFGIPSFRRRAGHRTATGFRMFLRVDWSDGKWALPKYGS